jgi:hypothetical protein
MKKIVLSIAAMLVFGFTYAQEGRFKLGAHVGLPIGDIKDFSSVNLGADVAYLWKVADKFDAGIVSGYTSYLGKDGFDAVGFIPIAATAQYSISDSMFLGADIGYGIGASSDSDGGFLYQPKIGFQTDMMEVYAAYKGISVNGGSFSSFNLGVNFKL